MYITDYARSQLLFLFLFLFFSPSAPGEARRFTVQAVGRLNFWVWVHGAGRTEVEIREFWWSGVGRNLDTHYRGILVTCLASFSSLKYWIRYGLMAT